MAQNDTRIQTTSQKSSKSIRFIDETHLGNSHSQNTIEPVVYGEFRSSFCEMAPKYQKALGFPVKVEGVLRLCKMSKSIGPRAFWSIEKVDQNTL